MSKKNKKRKSIFLELFLLILVGSYLSIIIYSAMQEGNHQRRIIVPEALDAPYQPYRPTENPNNNGMVTPMDSMMRDVYVVQREINQGSHQLYLFFDTFTHRPAPLDLKHFDLKNPKDAQWYNFGIYFIMFLLVAFPTIFAFIAKHFLKRRIRKNENYIGDTVRNNMGWIDKSIGFIIKNKIMIVFIVFMIAVLLSMVNLSIPLEKEFEYRADPFFVFVCFSSLAVAGVSLKYVLKRMKRVKLGGETSLSGKSIFRQTLFWGALGTWAMGFLCYFIGMYSLGTQKSVLASIVRPALESGKMFVLSDNIKEISFTLRNNGAFMGFYTMCKLGFLLISSFALVSLAWSRIVSYSTIRKRSLDPGDLYVFFGINENSKILAHDVAKRLREEKKKEESKKQEEENKDQAKERLSWIQRIKKFFKKNKEKTNESEKKWTIVMVENRNNPVEGMGNGMTISSLIGMFNFRKDAYAETREIDRKALLVISDSTIGSRECSEQINKAIERINNGEELDKETKYELFNSLGLKNLSKMIRSIRESNKNLNNNYKCHFFFLDEDARTNIDATDNLKRMLDIVHPDDKTERIIYCLARNNAISSLLEKSNPIIPEDNKTKTKKVNVKILDLSVMAAQSLFIDPDNHPINFVECDTTTATVKSRFEALLLGFGRGGRDIVGFLYEFGAFLSNDSMDGERSAFLCTIMDKDKDLLEPRYMAKMPAVRTTTKHDETNGQFLRFVKAALNSNDFVSLIDDKLNNKDMNFVVISLGSDKTNLGALTYLVDQAMRIKKGDLGKLRIFVRNYDPIYEDTLREQAEHFNQLLGGEKPVVNIFGRRSELLSYDMVVRDQIISSAKRFHDAYMAFKGDKEEEKEKKQDNWEQQNRALRQDTQNIHNGIHVDTKLRLIGLERHIHLEEKLKEQITQPQIKELVKDKAKELVKKKKTKWIKKKQLEFEEIDSEVFDEKLNEILQVAYKLLPYQDEGLIDKVNQKLTQLEDVITFSGRDYEFKSPRPDNKDISLMFMNLARNEHIRWVASLEMLGYQAPDGTEQEVKEKCDDSAKVHPGMGNKNDEDYQKKQKAYDLLLIKSSFEQAKKELEDQKEKYELARKDAIEKALNIEIDRKKREMRENARKNKKKKKVQQG